MNREETSRTKKLLEQGLAPPELPTPRSVYPTQVIQPCGRAWARKQHESTKAWVKFWLARIEIEAPLARAPSMISLSHPLSLSSFLPPFFLLRTLYMRMRMRTIGLIKISSFLAREAGMGYPSTSASTHRCPSRLPFFPSHLLSFRRSTHLPPIPPSPFIARSQTLPCTGEDKLNAQHLN